MPIYCFQNPNTGEVFDVLRPFSQSNKDYIAEDGTKCVKVFTTPSIVISSENTLENYKEKDHKNRVKDPERARKKRKKLFGTSEVENITKSPFYNVDKKVKSAKHGEVNKKDFIKEAAQNPTAVKAAQEVLKKKRAGA